MVRIFGLGDKPLDPEVFEKRVNEQLNLAQRSVDELLAVRRPHTIENTLAPYDNAIEKLDTAGDQSGLMQNLSPDAKIRDRAQSLLQKVSAASHGAFSEYCNFPLTGGTGCFQSGRRYAILRETHIAGISPGGRG